MLNYDANDIVSEKMNSPDRVIILKPKPGENTLSSKGMVDNRLFRGEQTLHAIMDKETSLWSLKYEAKGTLPEPLQQSFTSFKALLTHVTKYYETRGVNVEGVTQHAPSRYHP